MQDANRQEEKTHTESSKQRGMYMMSEGGVYLGLSPVGCSFRFIFAFRLQDLTTTYLEGEAVASVVVLRDQGSEFLFGS